MHGSRLAFVLPRIPTPTSWLVLSAGGRLARTREVAARSRLERPGIVVGWLVLLVRLQLFGGALRSLRYL